MTKLLVKKVTDKDLEAIVTICGKMRLEYHSNLLINILMRETVIQVTVLISAFLYIVMSVPLFLSWISVFLVIGTVVVAVLAESLTQRNRTEETLQKQYLGEDPKQGMWLLLASDSTVSKPFIVTTFQEEGRQIDQQVPTFKVVGIVGVSVKQDKDMKEPPNSVANIDHLYVSPPYRGEHLGEELLRTALSHCVEAGFRAVEMEFDDVHQNARKLCEKLDWTLDKMWIKTVIKVFRLESFTYRIACCQVKGGC